MLASSRPLPPRPVAVTTAAVAMLATALTGLGVALVAVLGMHAFNGTFRRSACLEGAASPIDCVTPLDTPRSLVDTTETTARIVFVSVIVTAVVCALVLAVLAFGVLRANTGARLGAWAMSAFGTVAALLTVAAAVLVRVTVLVQDIGAQASTTAAVVRSAQDAVPSWCTGLVGSLSAAMALGYIAVAILLAVPAAAAYFARVVIQPWQQPAELEMV